MYIKQNKSTSVDNDKLKFLPKYISHTFQIERALNKDPSPYELRVIEQPLDDIQQGNIIQVLLNQQNNIVNNLAKY